MLDQWESVGFPKLYYIFMMHVDVNPLEKISDDFIEFHHFMKKE